MPYLTRDGIRLYYEDHGQGVAILLSHGFGASTAVVVKHAGHGANVEQPEVVNEAIRQFLSGWT